LLDEFSGYGELALTKAALVDLDMSMFFVAGLFLVFYFVLNRVFIQPMLAMFDQRHALTGGAREEANSAVESAEERIERYEAQVGEARRTAVAEQKRLKEEGKARERDILTAVRKESDAQIEAGVAELQAQAEKAESEIKETARSLGDSIATRVMGGAA